MRELILGIIIGLMIAIGSTQGYEKVNKPKDSPMWVCVNERVYELVERK